MSNTAPTLTPLHGIDKARALAGIADNSERQAEDYLLMAEAIEALNINEETKNLEIARLHDLAEEMYEDADDLRGRIDPDLIDQL